MKQRGVTVLRRTSVAAAFLLACTAAAADGPQWGSSARPFAPDSPWNSRPLKPEFGQARIPTAKYPPAVMSNGWSVEVFVSKPGDPPVTIRGPKGSQGLWNPDEHAFRDVRIPRWPRDVAPASESDGHADIVDPVTGIVHSFWQLRKEQGEWVAAQYAWSSLRGRGWGDPAHYFQGARAVGVPAMGGLIRKHEVDDGAPLYRHALALSLTTNGLSPKPAYVFPATSADSEAAAVNTGAIPQGTLLMLPPSFDTAGLKDARVRKIAETLRTYGAYVVDRNDGVPFVIYAEIGSGLDLHKRFWNRDAVEDLERIRQELRPVVGAQAWVDGNGRRYAPERRLNLLSMRGPWTRVEGDGRGKSEKTGQARYDSWSQALMIPAGGAKTVWKAELPDGLTNVDWARPQPGKEYCLRNESAGGVTLRLVLGGEAMDSGELPGGAVHRFKWPATQARAVLYASNGTNGAAQVRGTLRECAPGPETIQAQAPRAPGK